MRNYLTKLYYKHFRNAEEEKRFMLNHDFASEGEAHRNDQKISACRDKADLLNELIDEFLQLMASQ